MDLFVVKSDYVYSGCTESISIKLTRTKQRAYKMIVCHLLLASMSSEATATDFPTISCNSSRSEPSLAQYSHVHYQIEFISGSGAVPVN